MVPFNFVCSTGAWKPPQFQTSTDECIDIYEKAQLSSALDSRWRFFQMQMKDENKNKSTFTSHLGTYRKDGLPFGFRNAPALFQQPLDIILFGVRWKTCLIYIDDVLILRRKNCYHVKDIHQVLALFCQTAVTQNCPILFYLKKIEMFWPYTHF